MEKATEPLSDAQDTSDDGPFPTRDGRKRERGLRAHGYFRLPRGVFGRGWVCAGVVFSRKSYVLVGGDRKISEAPFSGRTPRRTSNDTHNTHTRDHD